MRSLRLATLVTPFALLLAGSSRSADPVQPQAPAQAQVQVQSQAPAQAQVPCPDQPKRTPALIQKGKAAYGDHCIACHGARGHGDGPAADADAKPRDFGKEPFEQGRKPAEVHTTLVAGKASPEMCTFAKLSEDELWALSYYVLILRTAGKHD